MRDVVTLRLRRGRRLLLKSMLHVRGFAHLKKQPSSKALTPNNWDLIFEWPMKNPAEAGFSE
jgi:hypothetical protein